MPPSLVGHLFPAVISRVDDDGKPWVVAIELGPGEQPAAYILPYTEPAA